MVKVAFSLVVLGFLSVTGLAMIEVGYLGIWRAGLSDVGSLQITLDLVVSCALILMWLVPDARARNLTPWPWVGATLGLGSLGPLGYLVYRHMTVARNPVE